MIYFNFAGLSPTRPEVLAEMHVVQREFQHVRFSERGVLWYEEKLNKSKQKVAELLDLPLLPGSNNHLAFTSNATTAFRLLLLELNLQSGDVILTSDQEHPSLKRALYFLKNLGISLEEISAKGDADFLERLEEKCKKLKPKLIVISHSAYTDGRIYPVRKVSEIANELGVFLAVDGAQAAGLIPVDLKNLEVDFYFFSGHKWCCGPMGTGVLFISENYFSKKSRAKIDLMELGSLESYFDFGTQAIGPVVGLGKACEIAKSELLEKSHLNGLKNLLKERLVEIKDVQVVEWEGPHSPGILSFLVTSSRINVESISNYLFDKYEIAIKPFNFPEHPQLLRASFSLITKPNEITYLVDKLTEAFEVL